MRHLRLPALLASGRRGGPAIRVPLHHLIPGPNITAGMNPLVLMAIAHYLRTSTADVDPIEVFSMGWVDGDAFELWGIHEGRHRWMGSYIAGRTDIPCTPSITNAPR